MVDWENEGIVEDEGIGGGEEGIGGWEEKTLNDTVQKANLCRIGSLSSPQSPIHNFT